MEGHHSREQEKLFHKRLRMWAQAYVDNVQEQMTDKRRKRANADMELGMKMAVKVLAYNTGDARFQNILIHGSRKLGWHEYSDLINIMESEFPRVFGVEPPPLERDKTWNAEN